MATKVPPVESGEYEERHTDENHPYDGSGLAPRTCTDLWCMVALVVYLIVLLIISVNAFQRGSPRRLTHAYDYRGMLCGVDDEVKDMPLVYWCGARSMRKSGLPSTLDLKFPTCVRKCPEDKRTRMACLGIERVQVEEKGEKPFETQVTTITKSMVQQASYPTMELGGLYCIPHTTSLDLPGDDSLTTSLMGPGGPLGDPWARFTAAVGGLHRCWPVVAWSMVMAVGLGYGYLVLLQHHAKPLVEATLFTVTTLFLVVGIFFLVGTLLSGSMLEAWEASNLLFRQFDLQTAATISRVTGAIFLLLGLLMIFITYSSQDAIQTALGCVEPACECLFAMPSMLLQPLFEAVWKLCMGLFLLSGLTFLLSTAYMAPDFIQLKGAEVGGLTRSLVFPVGSKVMVMYYVFGIVWLMELTNAMSQFVVSYSVILWYYTPKPKGYGPHIPLVRGFIVGLVFHLGSLALGAFLLLVCRPLRAVMGYAVKHSKSGESELSQKVAHHLGQCVSCYHSHVEFISKNAYIDVCISSTNFCTAAKNSFSFVQMEGGKVLALTGSCYIFTLAGTLGISCVTGVLTYFLITLNSAWTSNSSSNYVENPYFVSAVSAALGGYVAACFMVVFDHTADALLYTYVWNKSHGHNTVQKYAPEALACLTEYKPIAKSPSRGAKAGSSGERSFFTNPFVRQPAQQTGEESQSLVRGGGFFH